jgi:hypothetical protein
VGQTEIVFWVMAETMPQSCKRTNKNPDARDATEVLGSKKPDNVSAACWNRPYEYLVIRVDDGRLKAFDDHQRGEWSRLGSTLATTPSGDGHNSCDEHHLMQSTLSLQPKILTTTARETPVD